MPTILVIDDEPTLRKLLGKVLQTAGYQVKLAETGGAALSMLETIHFDGVVCDLQLPDMGGVEVCRAIAALPQYGALPLILISGGSAAPHPSECRYSAFMRKPFQPTALIARLKQFVPGETGQARQIGDET